MHNVHLLPMFILIGVLVLANLAYLIQVWRFHWLDFDELPDEEQQRLLNEANSETYIIGGITAHPDPRVARYYTTIKKRQS